jgi:hypothetical protein
MFTLSFFCSVTKRQENLTKDIHMCVLYSDCNIISSVVKCKVKLFATDLSSIGLFLEVSFAH